MVSFLKKCLVGIFTMVGAIIGHFPPLIVTVLHDATATRMQPADDTSQTFYPHPRRMIKSTPPGLQLEEDTSIKQPMRVPLNTMAVPPCIVEDAGGVLNTLDND